MSMLIGRDIVMMPRCADLAINRDMRCLLDVVRKTGLQDAVGKTLVGAGTPPGGAVGPAPVGPSTPVGRTPPPETTGGELGAPGVGVGRVGLKGFQGFLGPRPRGPSKRFLCKLASLVSMVGHGMSGRPPVGMAVPEGTMPVGKLPVGNPPVGKTGPPVGKMGPPLLPPVGLTVTGLTNV